MENKIIILILRYCSQKTTTFRSRNQSITIKISRQKHCGNIRNRQAESFFRVIKIWDNSPPTNIFRTAFMKKKNRKGFGNIAMMETIFTKIAGLGFTLMKVFIASVFLWIFWKFFSTDFSWNTFKQLLISTGKSMIKVKNKDTATIQRHNQDYPKQQRWSDLQQ